MVQVTIVVPMAGAGSRFAVAGYPDPKPLITVAGLPMIQRVISNLRIERPHRFAFVCRAEHAERYDLHTRLRRWAPGSQVLTTDGLTRGAAETVLLARHEIEPDQPLIVANSDQYIDGSIDAFLEDMEVRDLDGSMLTMTAGDPKWSFAELDPTTHLVRRVTEKVVISDEATVGIYAFRRGRDFVHAADAMIADDERSNGEFYVAPVYNRLIIDGARVGVWNIGAEGDGMYGLGIPTDLVRFEALVAAGRFPELMNETA